MNLENCLRNELPPNLAWLRNQLVSHLKELRDRARKGEMIAVLHEFFNLYRFDDNQQDNDGFWGPDAAEVAERDAPAKLPMKEDCAYVWREDAEIAEGRGFVSFGGWQYSYRNAQGGGCTLEEAVKAAYALCPRIRVGCKRAVAEADKPLPIQRPHETMRHG
jgi:hypothetical protein